MEDVYNGDKGKERLLQATYSYEKLLGSTLIREPTDYPCLIKN